VENYSLSNTTLRLHLGEMAYCSTHSTPGILSFGAHDISASVYHILRTSTTDLQRL